MGDNKGNFEVAGLAMEGRATRRLGGAQEVEAYILDQDSGDIVYAPDLGNYGAKLLPNKIPINTRRRGVVLLHSLVYLQLSTTWWISGICEPCGNSKSMMRLRIVRRRSSGCPNRGSRKACPQLNPLRSCIANLTRVSKLEWHTDKLANASFSSKATKSGMKNPTLYTGEGFVVRENGQIRLTPYVVVRDMWWLDENRHDSTNGLVFPATDLINFTNLRTIISHAPRLNCSKATINKHSNSLVRRGVMNHAHTRMSTDR